MWSKALLSISPVHLDLLHVSSFSCLTSLTATSCDPGFVFSCAHIGSLLLWTHPSLFLLLFLARLWHQSRFSPKSDLSEYFSFPAPNLLSFQTQWGARLYWWYKPHNKFQMTLEQMWERDEKNNKQWLFWHCMGK